MYPVEIYTGGMIMTKKPRKVALYARVSTDGQTVDNQLDQLNQIAHRHEWEIVQTYTDKGISGAKGRKQRPQLDAMLKAATRKEFDMVVVWSVDRLGRSLQDLIQLLSELESKDIDLYLHQQSLDTTTPTGKAMFGMLGVFAEFERSMIQERVKAGLQRAKANGKKLGRPTITNDKVKQIQSARKQGMGIRKIAKEVGVGVGTVMKVINK